MMVEATKNRREIENLKAAYEAKFTILREITQKLKNKEPVDVAQELRIANAMTRNKYNSATDVELDEQFESFLRMAEEDFEPSVVEHTRADASPRSSSSKFL